MSFHRSFLIHRAFSHDGWRGQLDSSSWPWRRRSMLLWSGAAMALRTCVASVLPLLWLDGGCVAMLVWLDCLLRNCGTSWLQHGLDWQHFQVDAVGGGDVGLGIQLLRSARWMWREHVVSRAAIWSTCCSCCSCWWWLHRSVLGCGSRCDAAHATWSFKWHENSVRAIGMRRGHERGRHGGGAVVPSS